MRYKQASEAELKRIREDIKKENRASIVRQIAVIAIVIGLFILGAIFFVIQISNFLIAFPQYFQIFQQPF